MRIQVNPQNARKLGRGLRQFGSVASRVEGSKLGRLAQGSNPRLAVVGAATRAVAKGAKKAGAMLEAGADTYKDYKKRLDEIEAEDMEE